MGVPVNDFFIRVVGNANNLGMTYPAPPKPRGIKGIFSRKQQDKFVGIPEIVDQINQDIAEADLGNVTFHYGRGTVGSEGMNPMMFLGTPEPAKLEVKGSEAIANTVAFVSTTEDYRNIGIDRSELRYAHRTNVTYGDRKNKLEAFFNAQNQNADLTDVTGINAFTPEAISDSRSFGTVLHEFTHSANDLASFEGGTKVADSWNYDGIFNHLLDSDVKPIEDWMPGFQAELNSAYVGHGVEEARAELGRLSFLGHPSENVSKKIELDYISYIGRVSGENPNLEASGNGYRVGYSSQYEPKIRNYTPQAFKDSNGLVMDETEKWIQASLREAEMNAHAAGVMTILHNSEHIPGFQQQRELMMQLFEEQQKNNPQYGRIVENLRQTVFAPGEEPAFRVDIPGAKWLDQTAEAVPDATLAAVTPAEATIEELSPGVTKAGGVYTFTGDVLGGKTAVGSSVSEVVDDVIGSGSTLGTATSTAAEVATTSGAVSTTTSAGASVLGAVGGGAGASVTSTASTAATTTAAATTAAGAGPSSVTRVAAGSGKNVSEELVKGFKNVDNIRMAGVAAILGVGALAYSSSRRRN